MRVFSILLMVLGLIGVAVLGICGGNEAVKQEIIAQEKARKDIIPPAASINKVVIGVLNFERGLGKRYLMEELRRNTRVKVVDIPESCKLKKLKEHGYEQTEKYRMNYHVDMILHTYQVGWRYYFNLIDLYKKRAKEVSINTETIPVEIRFRGMSRKLLLKQDLDRVLTAKKKAFEIKQAAVPRAGKEDLEIKEATVPHEVKGTPTELEDLIHQGPKLIAEGQYNRVLDLIEDLPSKNRRHIQIRTLKCFANLKGWVDDKKQYYKTDWWVLRDQLISSGDSEATPMLVILLKEGDPYMRKYAAELLGHIGDKRALQDLREVGENDENSRVRRYAKWAYEQISGEKF